MARKATKRRKKTNGRRRQWGTILDPRPGRKGFGVRWPDPSKKSGRGEKWGFTSKDLAGRFLSKKQTELLTMEHGLAPRQIRKVTFSEFASEVLELKAVEWADSTRDHAQFTIEIAKEHFGQTRVDTIGIPEAQRYVAFLEKYRKNKPSTIARVVSMLSGLWERAIELGYARGNPWKAIRKRLKKAQEKEIPYISSQKLRALYDAVPDTRLMPGQRKTLGYRPLAILLGETGLRIGEAMMLRWTDVDDGFTELTVRKSKTYRGRTIPLTPLASTTLRSLSKAKARGRSDAIFAYLGATKESAGVAIGRYMRKAGFDGVSAHTFRHAFATGLMEAGNPITWVRDLLGHSRIETTLRYARWAPATAGKEAIGKLAKLRGQIAEEKDDGQT